MTSRFNKVADFSARAWQRAIALWAIAAPLLLRAMAFTVRAFRHTMEIVAPILRRWAKIAIPVLRRVADRVPWSCRFGAMSALLGIATFYIGVYTHDWYVDVASLGRAHMRALDDMGTLASFARFEKLTMTAGLLLCVISFLSFLRRRFVLRVLRIAGAVSAALWLQLLLFIVKVPSGLYRTVGSDAFDKYVRNELWIEGVWIWLFLNLITGLFILASCSRSAVTFYGGEAGTVTAWTERLLHNLRTNGRDPRFRKSFYLAASLHIFFLFILPIMVFRGCFRQAAYEIPKGQGDPIVQFVKIKRIKEKPKERIVLNLNSPILFYRPDIDESMIRKQLDDDTLNTYVASHLEAARLGQDGGKGGWPEGMENARVRFIRLEYNGGDWDQDMGVGSDYNILVQFKEMTGFKVAANTEHVPVRALRRFPKNRAPPFVFITGKGQIALSSSDIKTLRWYCLEEGGLIFADNGGGQFDTFFRRIVRQVFPDRSWVDIPSDDIIFRQPFVFPHGAPPLWHHSGTRAMGIKHSGRWIVFYHQGDLNDAWKDGHSGASPALAADAYRMGINVINYSFNQYMKKHFGG